MAFAYDQYTATASQTAFTISFSYDVVGDVTLFQNGSEVTQAAGAGNFSVSGSTATLGTGATAGDTIVIRRKTSQGSRTVTYVVPSTLSDTTLNNDSKQAFFLAQEAMDSIRLADFVSKPQTITDSSTLAVAHGLGNIPARVEVVLRCTSTELGYATSDELFMGHASAEATNLGFSLGANATNVFVITGDGGIKVLRYDTQAWAAITNSKWAYIIRAWDK